MRDYALTIPANGGNGRDVKGSFIKVKTASVELRVIAENLAGVTVADLKMSQGAYVNLPAVFDKVRVENPTGSQTEAVLIIGLGVVDDSQLSGQVSIGQGQTLKPTAQNMSTTPAQLLAADNNRRGVIIQNNDAAADIFIGDSTVTTANGLKVEAGNALTLDKAAAGEIWAVADTGTPEVRTLEELS